VSEQRTVLFVCLHGAGMSRIAAAYFNRTAPSGWRAVSAGVEPATALSTTAQSLLAGTDAHEFLDQSPPRSIDAVDEPYLVIVLRNPSIQYDLASDERWDLMSSGGVPLRDEICERAEAFARAIAAQERTPV